MKNVFKNLVLVNLLAGISLFGPFATNSYATFGVVLDPGHGGKAPGCCYEYDSKLIKEKKLNYKIALFLKDELSKYKTKDGEEVKVELTRDKSENPTLSERVGLAAKLGFNLVISLHNNAIGPECRSMYRGSLVIVTNSQASDQYKVEEDLAKCILEELEKIGLRNRGLTRKTSTDGTTYSNGDVTDWFGIIRNGIEKNIPSILIEHAFLSNEEDYRNFLSTDEKLKALAAADARGIAKYYNLVTK